MWKTSTDCVEDGFKLDFVNMLYTRISWQSIARSHVSANDGMWLEGRTKNVVIPDWPTDQNHSEWKQNASKFAC